MYNKSHDDDPTTNIDGRDIADLSMGTVGAVGTGLSAFGIISNPVGWIIGFASGAYGVATFGYDNRKEIQQGMTDRQNYIEQGLTPLR